MGDKIINELTEPWDGESAQNILRTLSAHVWKVIKFARDRKGLKIFETTITQEFLRYFMFAASETKCNIKLFEAKSESTNGNDIECFIETDKGFLMLPMQAKIIYENHKYPRINHQVGKRKVEQIDLLIRYAEKKKGFPLYLLYNYHKSIELLKELEIKTNEPHQAYGISYLDAYHIKENYYEKSKSRKGKKIWKIPSFDELHPTYAKPFHKILDKNCLLDDGYNFVAKNFVHGTRNNNLKMYTRKELIDDDNWIDLTPDSMIGQIPETNRVIDLAKTEEYPKKNQFDPKFRIMLSSKLVSNPIIGIH